MHASVCLANHDRPIQISEFGKAAFDLGSAGRGRSYETITMIKKEAEKQEQNGEVGTYGGIRIVS